MNAQEALRQCTAALQSAGERLEATETLCGILVGHVNRQRNDLQTAYAALARLETAARSQPDPAQAATEDWYGDMLK